MRNTTRVLRLSGLLFLISMITTAYGMAKPVTPANVISKEKAQAIALKAYAGKIKESDLEFENRAWIYSFEIIGHDKKTHEINVNAFTGDIMESKIETPAMEAKEKKEDLAAAKSTTLKGRIEDQKEGKEDIEEVEEKEERR